MSEIEHGLPIIIPNHIFDVGMDGDCLDWARDQALMDWINYHSKQYGRDILISKINGEITGGYGRDKNDGVIRRVIRVK